MTADSLPSLDIVIVNWNSGDQLRSCLASLASCGRTGMQLMRVTVVDNGSSDGSAEDLHSAGLPLVVLRNSENKGFARACNQGAVESGADYLLFLNPDTRLYADSLAAPIGFLEQTENRQMGICGIQAVDDRGEVVRSCARFPTPRRFAFHLLGLDRIASRLFPGYIMREWDHSDSRRVDHVCGAFYLVRGRLFEELGGFDERFFVYLEDVDFSLRAHRAGFDSYFFAGAKMYHRVGGVSAQVKDRRLYYELRSRIGYVFKHFSLPSAFLIACGTLCVEPAIRIGHATLRLAGNEILHTLRAYRLLWAAVLGMPRTRQPGTA
ncbi:MAG: glycosyltransferase family 2 protein [SAR324 cluster bacterium]|nr:glycosyltransferase family 2 protein [SAR324 cluster bacterium]